jgi:acyl-CoA synthetase (AMP-forming)/AMP-acid ligase II/thioesterase domain-containing protein/acyl carrier protein
MIDTLRGLIEAQVRQSPDAVALLAPDRAPLSYAQLLAHVDRTASVLRRFGIQRGDRVAVVLPNGPEMAAAFLAIAAGATCAPLNPGYRADEYDFHLADLNARALVLLAGAESPARKCASQRGIPTLELEAGPAAGLFELRAGITAPVSDEGFAQPGDIALLLHTSGTTSRPKIVPLTQANLCTSARNIQTALELTAADRCLNVMPLFHIHGLLGALLSSLGCGASVVCTPGFQAARFFEWLPRFQPTWYTAVPTMHQAVLSEAPHRAEAIAGVRLRLIRSCSAPLPPQVMAELERVFQAPVIESYGMTEASHQMASNPLPPRKRTPGSVGIAAGPGIAIMDENWNALPAGTRGEVAVSGANVTSGYENNPEANAGAFAGGWFRTGDQGYLDDEGYLFLTGRLKEIINRGGEKISPREIDEVLLDHPAVAQALAFAVPHSTQGEDVGAAVVFRPGAAATQEELRGFAAQRLADFKVPRTLVLLEEIPKGPTGKPQRIGLAERLGVGATQGRPSFEPPRTETEERLARIWSSVLKRGPVGIRDDFFALGGDSLRAIALSTEIEKAFGKRLPAASFLSEPTIEALARRLAEDGGTASPSSLVPLQPYGARTPLFCVHASPGTVLLYRQLAGRLAPDQPVHGLQSVGLDGDRAPLTTVSEMAAHYIEAIQKARPAGPYFLLGHCQGAYIALEMAAQLQERGESVGFLGVVSTDGAAREPASLHGQFQYHWSRLSRLTARQKWGYLVGRLGYRWQRVRQTGAELLSRLWLACGRPLPLALLRQRLDELNHRAGAAYRPRTFRGRITYLHGDGDHSLEAAALWERLASEGVHILKVPGRAAGVLREPHAGALARTLRDCLPDSAQSSVAQ